uniref:Uncharacterized protein n=2 Tax=Oryza meridionalis TaxID=40149 RepID=A0A0E0C3L9_9ORYZ
MEWAPLEDLIEMEEEAQREHHESNRRQHTTKLLWPDGRRWPLHAELGRTACKQRRKDGCVPLDAVVGRDEANCNTVAFQPKRPGKCVGRRQAADALKGGGVQQMRRRAPKGGVGCSAPGCLRAATRPEEGSRLWACLDGR